MFGPVKDFKQAFNECKSNYRYDVMILGSKKETEGAEKGLVSVRAPVALDPITKKPNPASFRVGRRIFYRMREYYKHKCAEHSGVW